MWLQMVATSLFALAMATALVTHGLPPIAYTIPDRLAVFNGSGFGGHSAQAGADGMAELRPL